MDSLMTTQVRQTLLRPLALARSAQIADVFSSEAEWRKALLADPQLLERLVGAPVEELVDEPQVASFKADVGFSASGMDGLVELHLGASDARHLGQVIRYAVHGSADVVLWLCDEVLPGDAQAVALLNKVLATKIVPVTVHALLLESGGHAFFPRVVAGEEVLSGRGLADGPASPRELALERFWRVFVAQLSASGVNLFDSHSPGRQKWIRTPVLVGSGVYYRVAAAADYLRVAVQVDSGDDQYNSALWDELVERRAEIEDGIDGELVWRAPGKTGTFEVRVAGGYSVSPERGARVAADVLGQMQDVMEKVMVEVPWRDLLYACRNVPTLL